MHLPHELLLFLARVYWATGHRCFYVHLPLLLLRSGSRRILVHWAVGSIAWGPGLRALAGSFGPGVLGHGSRMPFWVHLPSLLLGSGPLWSLVHWAVCSRASDPGLLDSADLFPGALDYWALCSGVPGPGLDALACRSRRRRCKIRMGIIRRCIALSASSRGGFAAWPSWPIQGWLCRLAVLAAPGVALPPGRLSRSRGGFAVWPSWPIQGWLCRLAVLAAPGVGGGGGLAARSRGGFAAWPSWPVPRGLGSRD